ncbi:hypothetical protein EV672_1109 [Aquabacterium commune]|uniref:Uncharacterized protein n=1 Tax=Aquabacterium commune TaxID=70586 RepID=A0A4R6R507_9BURK|nr:hypothetical protein [Aquabacterium commune]TDP80794.1 hypothetical protein EV672_1109 [Aquabacterium commune]
MTTESSDAKRPMVGEGHTSSNNAGVAAKSESIPDELRRLADEHFSAVVSKLPTDRMERFLFFVEVVRANDYWGVFAQASIETPEWQFDMMQWGWNMAVATLFEPVEVVGAFPMMRSTQETRRIAIGFLQDLGKVSLLRRLSDMAHYGIVGVERQDDFLEIKVSSYATAQFADVKEMDQLRLAETRIRSGDTQWQVVSMREAEKNPTNAMAFWAKANSPVKRWLKPDIEIEKLILTLVRPWETKWGTMVAYGAYIEVDKHFMAEALELATGWRASAGLHPDAKLGSITGADVASVMVALISLHLKHVYSVVIAAKHFKEISIAQSLAIWGPRQELEESISLMSGLSKATVHAVFDVIALTADRAKQMANHSTPLMPLLFDLGNGFVLRPVASLTRNPFTAATTLHRWEDPRSTNAIAADRESWMRSDLYGLFKGNRYKCILGNIKLRCGPTVVTDVDAAVYDTCTGELGIFQLKWQDYSTSDVRQLRSKASNLAAELQSWTQATQEWISTNGFRSLEQSLRLKPKRGEIIRSVYLFAISRSAARTQGYGIPINPPQLAISVWAQFMRTRTDVGPSPNVLQDLHKRLIEERESTLIAEPIPVSIQLAGKTVHIHNLWNRWDKSADEAPTPSAGMHSF